MDQDSPYGPLSPLEEQVLLRQGTEAPGSGRYHDFFGAGVYACRNCGAPLYRSDDKFPSGCGWPAFDDEIPGAVRQLPDRDGRRIEIRCRHCDAHLGHVFSGEGLTPRDTRHCVNSVSLVFEPQEGERLRRAVFAAGCFWGVEDAFKRLPGVRAVTSGYSGGGGDNPTYREVCSGETGHAEAVEVIYDPRETDFEILCRHFLTIHDPSQVDRQGPDVGSQYRSAVFYLDEGQKAAAEALLEELRRQGVRPATEVTPFSRFWNAEACHQDYCDRRRGAGR